MVRAKAPARQFPKVQPPADTAENNARYERLVEIADREVRRGRAAFYEAAKAMKELRDSKLYLFASKNWSDCCRSRWDYSVAYVNRMIDDAKTVDTAAQIAGQTTNHAPIGATELVTNEHQARLLKPYLPELSRRVVIQREEPRAVVDDLLDEARQQQAKPPRRSGTPASSTTSTLPRPQPRGRAESSPVSDRRSQVASALTTLLRLLDDETTKPAFDQCADLAEQVWKRLTPTWFARRSVSTSLERSTRTKP